MSSRIAQYTSTVAAGNDLTADEARACADAVFADAATELDQVVALLQALAEKGEAASEVTGFARAILERATPAPDGVRGRGVDLAGTGGSGLARFNVSTAAAFTVAAAGTPVVKHGNRGSRQPNGSFDFLDALGIDYAMAPEAMARCFAETGLAFFFARAWHPAMAAVAPARQQVARRTIFNLAAPLCNPAQPPYQFMGASSVAAAELLIEVLADLGRRRALVVCGAPGIDDLGAGDVQQHGVFFVAVGAAAQVVGDQCAERIDVAATGHQVHEAVQFGKALVAGHLLFAGARHHGPHPVEEHAQRHLWVPERRASEHAAGGALQAAEQWCSICGHAYSLLS